MEFLGMGRPPDKHIHDQELDALVPSSAKSEEDPHRFSAGVLREAERHVDSCASCQGKVAKCRRLWNRPSNAAESNTGPRAECTVGPDVDWHEVAAGLWPELRANQLIMHAAQCDHCGPPLRAPVDDDPTPEEERLLA